MAPLEGVLPQQELDAKFSAASNNATFVSASPDMNISKMSNMLSPQLMRGLAMSEGGSAPTTPSANVTTPKAPGQ